MPPKFQRARKPEEKLVRRQAILKAARHLVRKPGPLEFSLSDLARRSGVSKGNLYRYFESREEVLLQLWLEGVRDLAGGLEQALAAVPIGDIGAVSRAIVAGCVARPELCELTSIVSTVIERNLSENAVLSSKRTLAELTFRIATLLHARLPAIPLADCIWGWNAIGICIAGFWPIAHHGPVVAAVLARPEFASMQPAFERDFTRFIEVIFTGIMRTTTA